MTATLPGHDTCTGCTSCGAPEAPPARSGRERNIVTRGDGKLVNVNRQMGQLFVCAHGCCCGHEAEGKPPGHFDFYHAEWERRRIRNKVHLNMGGCLGPCPLANVAMLLFDGRSTFFHSMNSRERIAALYDYIEAQIAAGRYLPPPPALADFAFSAFRNDGSQGQAAPAPPEAPPTATPGRGLLVLTHSDTDVLAFASIAGTLDPELPPVQVHNVGYLRDEHAAVALFDALVPAAEIVLVKLHGGARSLPGFHHLVRVAEAHRCWLVAISGTDDLDPELTAYSTCGVPVAYEARAYLQLGGLENYRQCVAFLGDHLLGTGVGYDPPVEQPRAGIYHPAVPDGSFEVWRERADPARPTIGLTFYRSYWFSGDIAFIDTLVEAGEALGANVLPVYAYSLKDEPDANGVPAAMRIFVGPDGPIVDAIVNTMAFAMGATTREGEAAGDWGVELFERLGIPQLQAVNASISSARWSESENGLPPLDVAMSVAIPELDGRIDTVPASFKEPVELAPGAAGTPVVRRRVPADRAARIMGTALRLAALRRLPNNRKRVAVILSNHHAKAARIANAVGLDAPASLLVLLQRMRAAGYTIGDLPPDPDTLMAELVERGHYDRDLLTDEQLATAVARVPARRYREWFGDLPTGRHEEVERQWGAAPGRHYVDDAGNLALAGLQFGNVFVAVQPPRGYDMDKTAIMHKPRLPPPYPYHALYRWLAEPDANGGFGADAVIQMGKHGSLEWLPGKGVGLSADCYPDLFLGDLPLIYPFIIDGPGEGAAAKRRTHATIIDHLSPPMTTAGLYGELEQLDRLVDEYYLLERTDPARLPILQRQIWDLLQRANLADALERLLNADAGEDHTHEWDPREHEDGVPYAISDLTGLAFAHLVEAIHTYTHELGAAPIRDGLHVLGEAPGGDRRIDLLLALTRLRNGDVPSVREGLAAAYGLDLDAALASPGAALAGVAGLIADAGRPLNSLGNALEAIEERSRLLLEHLAAEGFSPAAIEPALAATVPGARGAGGLGSVRATLAFVAGFLVPALDRTGDEIAHTLAALDGRYVPAGPSGSLTRGMAHALPTGRNFYAIDPRAVPNPTAWEVGQALAGAVVERHLREEGRFPSAIGVCLWGTAAMRTAGEDIAQVLALIGVRPTWQPQSRRLSGLEVIPLAELGRPRIDVVCRISGFFRDAFPQAIAMLDDAFELVAALDEPPDQNLVRANRAARTAELEAQGLSPETAREQARFRIFGSQPGIYGVGILHLIDERNWQDDRDFATTYVNWGGYAYARDTFGVDARGAFAAALAAIDLAIKNQDNREHDIFDSDDYLQFHGGMIATTRALRGRGPRAYFGDTADPDRPRVRDLRDEADRVFRTRVVNPKWLAAVQRHGYRGATELTATVDYLFGYDATAGLLEDWHYARVAEAYALDPAMQAFLRAKNPWALRDIAARLLEAADRGLWEEPGPLRDALRDAYLLADEDIELRGER